MANTTVPKPWGEEIILTTPDLPYTAKILKIRAGHKLSLQYHDQKTETLCLISGQCQIISGPDVNKLQTQDMVSHQGYLITPNIVHRIIAVTDCLLIEASTPETGTTFRLEDDYQRPDETPEIRDLPNRQHAQ